MCLPSASVNYTEHANIMFVQFSLIFPAFASHKARMLKIPPLSMSDESINDKRKHEPSNSIHVMLEMDSIYLCVYIFEGPNPMRHSKSLFMHGREEFRIPLSFHAAKSNNHSMKSVSYSEH